MATGYLPAQELLLHRTVSAAPSSSDDWSQTRPPTNKEEGPDPPKQDPICD